MLDSVSVAASHAGEPAALIGGVVEVFTIVRPQIPHSEKHDDEDQDDNCCQADHDLGHHTIQRGMA
jgi:hypothetical protein